MHSFAVGRAELQRVEAALAGGELDVVRAGNRVLEPAGDAPIGGAIRERVSAALQAELLGPEAMRNLQAELLHLAAHVRSWGVRMETRPEAFSRRRAAVRRVEEYLDAHQRELPSMAELCAIAGVSERTLEYAFHEEVGLAPARYLRRRRLNQVRRELQASDPDGLRVTDVAMRWGFWQLGRFAAEYRALFGERPSETLAAAPRKPAPRVSRGR
jgi:AraC family ethanolamine operon transcriptional activator